MPTIRFIEASGDVHDVEVSTGETVMDAATNNMVPGILGECGGACACATCHVFVAKEWQDRLNEPTDMEKGMLEGSVEPPKESSRLACQLIIEDDWDGFEVSLPARQI